MSGYEGIVGLIVAIVGSTVSYVQQSRANKALEESANEYNKKLQEEAIRQYGELDKVEADTVYESHAKSLDAQRQYLQARSTIALQAAVTGTYGNSVNVAIADLKTGYGGRMADIIYQRDSELEQVKNQAERIRSGTGSGSITPLKKPAFMGALQSGLSGFNTGYNIASKVGTSFNEGSPAGSLQTSGVPTTNVKPYSFETRYNFN